MKLYPRLFLSTLMLSSSLSARSLEWALGFGDGRSLYQEANWIDAESGEPAATGDVDPNVELDADLIVRAGNPGGGSGAGGNLLMGSGELMVSGGTLRMSRGQKSMIDMGSTGPLLEISNGRVLAESIANGEVVMRGESELTLYGSDPLTGTTVDLQSEDCFVYLLDRLPSNTNNGYLSRFLVGGEPAVLGDNILITEYYNGAVLRPKAASGVVVKAFGEPDLKGDRWTLWTGFKGLVGLGSTAYDSGTYRVAGWGSDIWGNSDQMHFAQRVLNGDGEMITRVNSIGNTNVWAKGGIMIRETLDADSRNTFVFQRPDGQVFYQRRVATGGTTSSATGGEANWLRLVRSGDVFTSYYSASSATGPWTEIASNSIPMATQVYIGLAATSHNGFERGTSVFSQVTLMAGGSSISPSGELGVFTATSEIQNPWNRDDQMSSFLLKTGYMATVAEHAGGQGASQVYIASERDLLVNLPPELDKKVSYMRILPWRWLAKKGWGGGNTTHMNNAKVYWNYQWEPTGASNINREWVPMIRGRNQNKDFRWEEVRVRGGQTHFLCFNEPESASQGDLTVDEAIALWPKAQQLGLRIGSPGRTDNNRGDLWLQEFMNKADEKGYRVDYVSVHNYAQRSAAGLKRWLDAEHAKYNRPIWLTEFQRDTGDNPTAEDHRAFLEEVIPMLEDLDYLERYAYYNFGTANPPNENASLFSNGGALNDLGEIYAGVVSNPGYRNIGQPAWADASLSLGGGKNVVAYRAGETVSVTSSIAVEDIRRVEFFVNGGLVLELESEPFELPMDDLPHGLQTIMAVVTTDFGEQVLSPARQMLLHRLEIIPSSPGPNGEIKWSSIPGESYHLEGSDDLSDWTLVARLDEATGFSETLVDPAFGTGARRYYRIVWE